MATSQDFAAQAAQYAPGSAMYQFWAGLAANPSAANNANVAAQIADNSQATAMPVVYDNTGAQVPYNAPAQAGQSYTVASPGTPGIAPAGQGTTLSVASQLPRPAIPTPAPAPASAPSPAPAPSAGSATSIGRSSTYSGPQVPVLRRNPAVMGRQPGQVGSSPVGSSPYIPPGSRTAAYGAGDQPYQQPNPRGGPIVGGFGPGDNNLPSGGTIVQPGQPPPYDPTGGSTNPQMPALPPSGPNGSIYAPGRVPQVSDQGGGPLGLPSGGFTPIGINNSYYPNAPQSPGGPGYVAPMGPVAGGANPVFQNWSNTPGGNGQGYQGGDPGYMASAEANRAIDYGNNFEQQYGSQYQQALAQQNAYQGTADQSYNQLSQMPGYSADEASGIAGDPYSVMGVVDSTRQAMGAAIDPSKLGMSDAQVQALQTQAGGQIGANYGAALDQLQRQSEASGNVNPLALSAARDRLLRSQAVDQADALTNASLAAQQAQRQANTNIANMQLGAATTIGGMGLNAGQYADTAASNRAANIAQQRIQGQQAARNYWQSQGQFAGSQANQASQARLAGAQTSLSGMGQGGQLAATTEIGRKSTRPQIGFNAGPGGITVGGNVGV